MDELNACKKKRPYLTESAARLAGHGSVMASRVERLFVYRCVFCGDWHLSAKQGPNTTLPPITRKGPFDGQ